MNPDRLALMLELGISVETLQARGLREHEEAPQLEWVETAADGREFRLTPAAAQAWRQMKAAALQDGVALRLVSAFRSVARQVEIVRAKLEAGEPIEAVLQVCAPPGFSEHHTGRAVDIGTPDDDSLELDFETTPAFAWLQANAAGFGFQLSYPRGNAQGFQYEPWHWCHQPA